ncbi:hypothetical protein SCE1572_12290 [Sorangium cellulosum So0157-2]|uniref:PEGA domain-containing protein n=1 Tax=Sorangium cellulosum So0157-2 TaxID=1254432 RepID=S4XS60_SORCE|nr:hypothetical protein SCE1572_12290 [Sorangium cellulosum So0157-2]
MREAEAAFDRLDIALARQIWARIHELERTNVAMCQLGQLDRRLARWVDAVGELELCVAQMKPPETPREHRLYETRHDDLAVARQHVAEVAVLAPPGAAAVLVSGRRVGATGRIYVAPGQHEVSAALADGRVVRTTVSAEAGESRTALLAPPAATPPVPAAAPLPEAPLVAEPPPVVTPPLPLDVPPPVPEASSPVPPDPTSEEQPAAPLPPRAPEAQAPQAATPRWIVPAGAAASLALLATGVALHVAAASERAEVRTKVYSPDDTTWRWSTSENVASVAMMDQISTATLVAGTTLAGATLIYAVLRDGTQIRARVTGVEVMFVW